MARRKKGDKVDGWINLDKPLGLTSTQAMAKVRRALNAQKAGHAGTLDPLATGVLPIALGEATKTIQFIQDGMKTYSFTITWGEQRDTDDSEGDIIATSDMRPTQEQIRAALPDFIGEIEQTPPRFSAIKIDGQRAYDLARGGEEFEIKSREVYIESLQLLHSSPPVRHPPSPPVSHPHSPLVRHPRESGDLDPINTKSPVKPEITKSANRAETSDFTMHCGKGTYVRSLARDLALKLGTFGYISALRREEVWPFHAKDAISLDKLEELSDKGAANEALLPLRTALDDIPALALRADEMALLKNGQVLAFISRPDFERLAMVGIEGKEPHEALAVFEDKPVALVEVQGPKIKPVRVFNL